MGIGWWGHLFFSGKHFLFCFALHAISVLFVDGCGATLNSVPNFKDK